MPRMRMARRMDRHSAPMVGKSRNITDMGIVTAWGMCSRSMAEMNSLTEVEAIRYSPMTTVTTNRVRIPPHMRARKFSTPVRYGKANSRP